MDLSAFERALMVALHPLTWRFSEFLTTNMGRALGREVTEAEILEHLGGLKGRGLVESTTLEIKAKTFTVYRLTQKGKVERFTHIERVVGTSEPVSETV